MASYYVETLRSSRKHHRDLPAPVRRRPIVVTAPIPPKPAPSASAAPSSSHKTPSTSAGSAAPPAKEEEAKPEKAKSVKSEKAKSVKPLRTAKPTPKETPKEEEKPKSEKGSVKGTEEGAEDEAPASEPASETEWTAWQPVEGGQWDGYWRAKPRKDNGWSYQFTKDFVTIWGEASAAESETTRTAAASSSSPLSSSTAASTRSSAGEPVLLPTQPTAAFATTVPHHHLPLDSSLSTYAVDDDAVVYASYGEVAVSTAIDPDLSGLTLETPHSFRQGQGQGQGRRAKQKRKHRHKHRHHHSIIVVDDDEDNNNYNNNYEDHHYHHQQEEIDQPVPISDPYTTMHSNNEAAKVTTAGTDTAFTPIHGIGEASRKNKQHHAGNSSGGNSNSNGRKRGRGKAHHGAHSQTKQARRHPHHLGEVVRREKNKRFNSRAIVDNWQLG